MFFSFQFFVYDFGDEATNIQKYYIIFVYILQSKTGKTEKTLSHRKENHVTKVTK